MRFRKKEERRGARAQVLDKFNLESIIKRPKRSLSPVIATVMLIALVIVLAIIIFMWAKSFISERIEKFSGQSIEDTCSKVVFDAVPVQEGTVQYIEVTNRGDIPLFGIGIKQKESSGDSKMDSYNVSVAAGNSLKGAVNPFESDTQSLIIYPEILGSVVGKSTNKIYTCLQQGIVVPVSGG